jgi:hypothetical protein
MKLRLLWRRLLYGGESKLRSYELACLDAWRARLPESAQAIVDQQVQRFSMIQRLSADKLVTLHDLADREYATWSAETFFPLRAEEYTAAKLKICLRDTGTADETGEPLSAAIVLHRGRISSIEFNKSPLESLPGAVWDEFALSDVGKGMATPGIDVSDVSISGDVLSSATLVTEPLERARALPGWLHEWAQRWPLEYVHRPLSVADRDQWLGQLEGRLPAEYLGLMERTNGVKIGPCIIYGLSEIRTVVLPRTSHYVLAAVEGGTDLVVLQGDASGMLYRIDYEQHDSPTPVGESFGGAIGRLLEGAKP